MNSSAIQAQAQVARHPLSVGGEAFLCAPLSVGGEAFLRAPLWHRPMTKLVSSSVPTRRPAAAPMRRPASGNANQVAEDEEDSTGDKGPDEAAIEDSGSKSDKEADEEAAMNEGSGGAEAQDVEDRARGFLNQPQITIRGRPLRMSTPVMDRHVMVHD